MSILLKKNEDYYTTVSMLSPGTVFLYGNEIYVKVEGDLGKGVNLTNGHVVVFNDGDKVVPAKRDLELEISMFM